MDEVQFFRHYVQPFTSTAMACRRNAGGYNGQGSNEGIASPRSAAYAPAKNVYGDAYGVMTQVVAGQQLCWRWPAKNHFAHVNVATNPLFVNWDDVANRATDLTQTEMDTKRLTDQTMLWANCPVPGPASNGDSTGVGSELRPCGGCFTVPNRGAGIYTVQWEWPFKNANSETYTSCADIEILPSTPTNTAATNCAVSAWGNWGTCSSNCGTGRQTRTRTITQQPTVTGTPCPTLTDTQNCNTQSCATSPVGSYISQHVIYQDSLVDFTDWSWAGRGLLNLASTNVRRGSSGTAIQWQPRNWQAVYFHHNIGSASIEEYQSISFWLNGGASGGQSITFSLVTTGRTSSPLFTYPIPRNKLVANTWNQVDIKFSDLRLTKGMFDGIWWQANSGSTQSTLYIDDIYFMHVHEGGVQELQNTDACAGVTCGANSACLGGQCYCVDGYWGLDCSRAPVFTDVSLRNLADNVTTAINGGETLQVSWTANGSMPVMSVLLYKEGSAVPQHLVNQANNEGSWAWMVPMSLEPGSYKIRVQYSKTVYGETSTLTKTDAAMSDGCSTTTGCSGHGICDEDTAPDCVCRFGYTGGDCATAPDGIGKIRSSIIVNEPVSLHDGERDKFRAVLQQDLSAALLVQTDQIEIVDVQAQSSATSLVTFDLVTGGQFVPSALAITDEESYAQQVGAQLALPESGFNRATYTYAAATTGANAASPRAGAASAVAAAVVLAAAAAIAF